MLLKQKWVFVVLILVLSPVSLFAQTSLQRLSTSKSTFGISVLRADIGNITPRNITTLSGNLDYGINYNLKTSFQFGVGMAEAASVPPSPIAKIGLVYISQLEQTGLEYFAGGNLGAAFLRVVSETTDELLERSRILNLSGTIGLIKRTETEEGLEINPFFSLSYGRFWETSETNAEVNFIGNSEDLVLRKSSDYGNFAGEIGVEVELSPTIMGITAFKFSFERFDFAFRLGLNFH